MENSAGVNDFSKKGMDNTLRKNGGGGPTDPSQFATKQELKDVETNLTHRMDLMEANLDARFEEVNTKFEKVNTRFEGVNTQFESVNTKIEKSKNSLIIWYIGTNIVLVGVILAAIRFMI